jgi:hypothetical protein
VNVLGTSGDEHWESNILRRSGDEHWAKNISKQVLGNECEEEKSPQATAIREQIDRVCVKREGWDHIHPVKLGAMAALPIKASNSPGLKHQVKSSWNNGDPDPVYMGSAKADIGLIFCPGLEMRLPGVS